MATRKTAVPDSSYPSKSPTGYRHATIYEAINAVMMEVGYVAKSGTIQPTYGKEYSYAGEADLIAALRPAMVEHGIMLYPAGISDLVVEQQFSGGDKPKPFTHVHGRFSFVFQHAHSDTHIVVEVIGEAIDYGDKAANKAMTIAYKYALRQAFLIETGDDPDKYASDAQTGGLEQGNGNPPSQGQGQPETPRRPTNVKPVKPPVKPTPAAEQGSGETRPFNPEALQKWFDLVYQSATEEQRNALITEERAKALAIDFRRTGLTDDERRAFGAAMFGIDSFKSLSVALANGVAAWLKDVKSARQEVQDYLASLPTGTEQ